jgi:hypothetical protein
VALWLNLMLQLGVAFDDDPLLPWGGQLPAASQETDSFHRLNAIYDTADAYLEEIAGKEGEHFSTAIDRFLQASPQELVEQSAQSSEQLINVLARLYPEKHLAVDYGDLQSFMQATIALCLNAGINVKDKIVLLIVFDFLMGFEAHASPLYLPELTNLGTANLVDMSLSTLIQRMKSLLQRQMGGR